MFELLVLTPLGKVLEKDVDAVYVTTSHGRLGLLKDHTPIVSELANKGVLKALSGEKEIYLALYHGVLKMHDNRVTILSESAYLASSEEDAKNILKTHRAPLEFSDHSLEMGEKMLRQEK